MDKLSIVSQLKEGRDLLSLPQALAEILREVDKPDFNSEALARIILKDPPLTGRILKMANSPAYKRFADIATVHMAVQVLGATTVKCLALSSSVFHPEQIHKSTGIDPQAYFARILTVATACNEIAQAINFKAAEEAFIAGLLHDIGTMFMIHHYPDEYRKVLDRKAPNARDIIEAERMIFGIDHCEAGSLLATRWRLPAYIAEAINNHHQDTEAQSGNKVVPIVRLATLLAEDSSFPYPLPLEERLRDIGSAAGALGLSKVEVDGISMSMVTGSIAVAEYLGLDIGNIEEMLTRANKEIWSTYLMIENLFKERQDLSRKLLQQERARGAYESKTIAMATLSHYLNNAAMVVSGRSQMMRMQMSKGKTDILLAAMPATLDTIDKSIKKMVAVLAEMSEISPMDQVEFLNASQAMNMDDRIATRMEGMADESPLVLPEGADIHS